MAATDYTRVQFESLNQGQQNFVKAHKELEQRLNDLEKYLESHLAEWEGDAVQAYWNAKRIWDAECDKIALMITQMGGAIGNANKNYSDTEDANRRRWG